jgi:hypothetical protein
MVVDQLHGFAAQPRPHYIPVGTYDVGGSVCERALTSLPEVIVAGPSDHTVSAHGSAHHREPRDEGGHDAIGIRVLDLLAVTPIRDWMEANRYN